MAAGADGEYPFEAEIPLKSGVDERHDETARCCIYVDWNVVAGLLVVLLECIVEGLDIVVESCPGHTHDGHDADGVLVAHGNGVLGIERELLAAEGHGAHLNLPQLRELLPYYLIGCRDYKVWLVAWLALCCAVFLPSLPGRHATKHAGFA